MAIQAAEPVRQEGESGPDPFKETSAELNPGLKGRSIREANSPEAFFKEIGEDLFLLGKEITLSKNVQGRIDLLAVDREGVCVVIELKRGSHKLHMMQAISYAGSGTVSCPLTPNAQVRNGSGVVRENCLGSPCRRVENDNDQR